MSVVASNREQIHATIARALGGADRPGLDSAGVAADRAGVALPSELAPGTAEDARDG